MTDVRETTFERAPIAGADPLAVNNNKLSARDLARARGHAAAALTLGHACLFLAARDGDVALLERLLDEGVDVNARFADGWTALMIAARYDRPEAVAALLRRGADPAAENHTGWTALLIAERKGQREITGILRQARAAEPPRHLEVEPDSL